MLCSPVSAQSHYVNEEVRLFKIRHPERPVVPVIAGGKAGDQTRECFALALRFEVDASGTVTDRPSEVLAANLREEGDGRELALAKVVAALIGVSPDEVYRRAERERKRQARFRNGAGRTAGAYDCFRIRSQRNRGHGPGRGHRKNALLVAVGP